MKKVALLMFIMCVFLTGNTLCQVIFIPIPVAKGFTDYEHGFLPGKKFPFYQTIEHYDFKGLTIRVELSDDRNSLGLQKINCSKVLITNTSEFKDPNSVFKVGDYIDTLFAQSNIIIDSTSTKRLEIRLEVLDARLIGAGFIRVHGLCQIKVLYEGIEQTYCMDIMDGDPHSPLGKTDFVTRRTATRLMASASVREVIELVLKDIMAKENEK